MIIYTAHYGNKDFEIPPDIYSLMHQDDRPLDLSGIEFVYFTDRKRSIPGWNVIVDKKRSQKNDLMRSKWFKLHSHELFPDDVSMYIDANRALKYRPDEEFAITTAEKPVTLFRHYRTTLLAEFLRCIPITGLRDALREMRFAYTDLGLDLGGNPVYHGNTLIRHPNAREFNELWWKHIKKYVPRDQLSLPYVAWKMPELVNIRGSSGGNLDDELPTFKSAFHTDSKRRYGVGGPNRVPNYLRYRQDKSRKGKRKVLFVIGTRPEAIKLAPVILEAKRRRLDTHVLTSGQHPEMAAEMLTLFDIEADTECRTPSSDVAGILQQIQPKILKTGAKIVVVQGDTNTAVAGAMAGFYNKIPVAYVEAGLRTWDLSNPFPEEGNRRMISGIATYQFAPTSKGKKPTINPKPLQGPNIHITGNTGIDALFSMQERAVKPQLKGRTVLLTLHRRESWGEKAIEILQEVEAVASRLDFNVIFPLHPNPAMQKLREVVKSKKRIKFCEPMGYLEIIGMLKHCELVLTDSGGLQEEAAALNKPYVVLREKTERPEGIDLKGMLAYQKNAIKQTVELLMTNKELYSYLASNQNPFGDGHAAERIIRVIEYATENS